MRLLGEPKDVRLAFIAPYYSQMLDHILPNLQPDTSNGEAPEVPRYEARREPGSTAQVSFWTGRDVRDTVKSHVNYLVADTRRWEQQAGQYLDGSRFVAAWVKNAGLGFGIPYEFNAERHEYIPDFIVRLANAPLCHLILETKGFDPQADVKKAAAERWVNAVNADGAWGRWYYRVAYNPADVPFLLDEVSALASGATLAHESD